VIEGQIDRLIDAGFNFVEKFGAVVLSILALTERGVVALEMSAEAQEQIAEEQKKQRQYLAAIASKINTGTIRVNTENEG
jgi:hypothetical protein